MNFYEKLKHKLPTLEDEIFYHRLERHVYQYYLTMHYAFISFFILSIIVGILVIFNRCAYIYGIYAVVGVIICAALKVLFRYFISKLNTRHGNKIFLDILSGQSNIELEILQKAIENKELDVTDKDLWKYYNAHPEDVDDSNIAYKTIEEFINNCDIIKKLRKKDHTDEIQHYIRAEDARIRQLIDKFDI